MGFCLVLNLTTTCTDGKWAVIWPPKFATKYVSFATNFYTGYQIKKLISSTALAGPTTFFLCSKYSTQVSVLFQPHFHSAIPPFGSE